MLRSKAPKARISAIGFGVQELIGERFVSSSSASDSGVARFWEGVEGNLYPIGSYNRAVLGLDRISQYHENPRVSAFPAALVRCVDTSTVYDKFNLSTAINLGDFAIKGIYGDVGDISVSDGTVSWKNEGENGLVSGTSYTMSILLRAKDETVEKHKLYRLNTNTTIESDDEDVEAEYVSDDTSIVLMNGFELEFDANNSGTCSLGDNQTRVYLAHQKIDFDLGGVSCDGWNFDTFKDSETGLVFSNKNNEMPAKDTELVATWRKTDVEIHMDGTIYVAPPAVLKPGADFNNTLYSTRNGLANNKANIMLKAEDGCPSEIMDDAHRLSADDSVSRVYAWVDTSVSNYEFVDPDTGEGTFSYSMPLYYCSDADKIKLNEDSSRLFFYGYYQFGDSSSESYDIANSVKYIEGIEDWDASDVKKLDYAFSENRSLGALTYEAINNWDISNVESMDGILSDRAGEYNSDNDNLLSGWDTSNVKSMKYAFSGNGKVLSKFGGIANWDVSNVEDMTGIFSGDRGVDLSVVADWDVSSVKKLDNAFASISSYSTASDFGPLANWGLKLNNLESMNGTFSYNALDGGQDFGAISNWNTSNVKSMSRTFASSKIKNLSDIESWNVSGVENMSQIFSYASLNVGNGNVGSAVGIDSWDVSSVKDLSSAFQNSNIVNLGALSGWHEKTSNVEDLSSFLRNTSIVDLAGLEEWDTSSVTTLASAFEDDSSLTDLSALAEWDVSKVESLARTFKNISADNVMSLKKWTTSSVKNMSFTFCGQDCTSGIPSKNGSTNNLPPSGGIKSLSGVEGWDTSSVVNMSNMLAGGSVTDLSPLSGWDVTSVEDLAYAFMRLNITTLEPLLGWETNSLEGSYSSGLTGTFAMDRELKNLHGLEGWDVSGIEEMDYTFAFMDKLEDISALSEWDTSSLRTMVRTFQDHKKLTSLDGIQNWDVSNLGGMFGAFMGYSPYTWDYYTDWANYCDSSLTDISALAGWGEAVSSDEHKIDEMSAMLACNNRLSDLTPLSSWHIKNYGVRANRFLEGDRSVLTLDGMQNMFSNAKGTSFELNYAFMNMTSLRDINALADWVDNDNVSGVQFNSAFRNDSSITSLAPLENTIFKKSAWYSRENAFDNIPTSVARPSWY